MFSTNQHRLASRKQLRSFGLILAAGFLVIGSWPMIFRHQDVRGWALTVAVVSALMGLAAPLALRYPYRVWMFLGECLGWINSRIILGALYYGIVTPMRIGISLVGHDPMNRKYDPKADTYRVTRKPRSATHMTHPF